MTTQWRPPALDAQNLPEAVVILFAWEAGAITLDDACAALGISKHELLALERDLAEAGRRRIEARKERTRP